jgi:hypothetical protein
MAKSKYLKTLEIGEWLESVLDDNLIQWDIFELINRAFSILAIDRVISRDSYFINLIETIQIKDNQSLKEAINAKYGKIESLLANHITSIHNDGKDKLIYYDEYQEELKKLHKELNINPFRNFDALIEVTYCTQSDKNNVKSFSHSIKFSSEVTDVISLTNAIDLIRTLFKKLNVNSRPWQRELPIICNDLAYNQHSPFYHRDYRLSYINPFNFIKSYNDITDYLSINNDIVSINRCIIDHHFPKNDNSYASVPIIKIFSNIFLDFLLLGGQDYYGFCEYCDKFFVVQRKGRKKFCSDICRVNSNKQKKLDS